MTCYIIRFVYKHAGRSKGIRSNEHFLANMSREYRSAIEKMAEFEDHTLYGVSLCDEDAAHFLRDLPSTYFCDQIMNMSDKSFLYKNIKIYDGYRNSLPSNKEQKNIFWNAKQMERWVNL